MTGRYPGRDGLQPRGDLRRSSAPPTRATRAQPREAAGCTFGVASSDVKCQIWQDLAILGPAKLCGPSSPCPQDLRGRRTSRATTSWDCRGARRSPRRARPFPTSTPRPSRGARSCSSSGSPPQYGSLGARLDAILGRSPSGEGRIDRLVDLTVGINPGDGRGHGAAAVDLLRGRVLAHGRLGVGVRIQRQGHDRLQQVRDLLRQRVLSGGIANVNVDLPARAVPPEPISGFAARRTCSGSSPRRTSGSGIQRAGPPGGRRDARGARHQSRPVRRFRRHVLRRVSHPLTFNGAVLGLRGIALARDWADPTRPETVCATAQPPCRPITFVRGETRAVGWGGGGAGGS